MKTTTDVVKAIDFCRTGSLGSYVNLKPESALTEILKEMRASVTRNDRQATKTGLQQVVQLCASVITHYNDSSRLGLPTDGAYHKIRDNFATKYLDDKGNVKITYNPIEELLFLLDGKEPPFSEDFWFETSERAILWLLQFKGIR